MHHPRGDPSQSSEGLCLIELTQKWRNTDGPQHRQATGTRGQRQHLDLGRKERIDSNSNITTANDQNPLTPKSCGQCSEGALV